MAHGNDGDQVGWDEVKPDRMGQLEADWASWEGRRGGGGGEKRVTAAAAHNQPGLQKRPTHRL